MHIETVGTPVTWAGFVVLVIILLAVDLNLFRGKELTFRQACAASAGWFSLAAAFNVYVFITYGHDKGLEFTTGYVIEEALSIDNLFVFIVIFSYFGVPVAHQRRVLYWGILGALVMRAIFILVGGIFLQTFAWAVWVFGGILVFTGLRLIWHRDEQAHPEKNPVVILARRFLPMTTSYHGARFFIVRDGKRYATPLMVVLLTVEATDVVFAVDSIPAVFAVTDDPFIVFTSNIFAILGLRSLYFLLASVMNRFHYLKLGLACVLIFVGTKMLGQQWFHVPIGVSLGVVAALLAGSIVASLLRPARERLPRPAADYGRKTALPEELLTSRAGDEPPSSEH